MTGAAGDHGRRHSGCSVAAFRSVLISQCGVDLLQAARDGLPAPDQFPSFVPDPPLSKFHALPPSSAISFVVESVLRSSVFLRQFFRVRPGEHGFKPIDLRRQHLPQLRSGISGCSFTSTGRFASFKQAPGHPLTMRKSLERNEESLALEGLCCRSIGSPADISTMVASGFRAFLRIYRQRAGRCATYLVQNTAVFQPPAVASRLHAK